jgi:predicted unusual protein kinase regulating ubiquinone biosynthesis (AarF/ABC1/UbiB family)
MKKPTIYWTETKLRSRWCLQEITLFSWILSIEYSSEKIITMDWWQGVHLSEFKNSDPVANKIGKLLWDFTCTNPCSKKKVHADPHPGNFMVNDKKRN